GEIIPRLSAYDKTWRPGRNEHNRDASISVVVVGHCVAICPCCRHRQKIIDTGCVKRRTVDQDVATLTVPTDYGDGLALGGVQPVRDSGLETLLKKRHLEVVSHATVDGNERRLSTFDGHHSIDGRRCRGHHAAAWFDDDPCVRRQVLTCRSNQHVEILR